MNTMTQKFAVILAVFAMVAVFGSTAVQAQVVIGDLTTTEKKCNSCGS